MMPVILTGSEAQEALGHLTLRDPVEMRRQNAEAIKKLRDIFAAQGMLLVNITTEAME
jgi:hypothetical protein